MDTRNGITRVWLSEPSEQAANRKPQTGGIPQEANALGNARDTLTWGRSVGGSACTWSRSLVTDACGRTEDRRDFSLQLHSRIDQAATMVRYSCCGADTALARSASVTTAHRLRSRVRRKSHARFCTGGGAGDCSADRNLGRNLCTRCVAHSIHGHFNCG